MQPGETSITFADMILSNGKFYTMNESQPMATSVAISKGKFIAVGSPKDTEAYRGVNTKIIDLNNQVTIPGLYDSHIHLIRGGLNYNMELRWDGVTSLSDALNMVKLQAERTPPPQWVRVIGGWSEYQFKEKRMPTLKELNDVAPDTPVFIMHLYDRALLNAAALRAIGYDKNTPDNFKGGCIERDKAGNPTGLFLAKPNAFILYNALNKGPKLSYQDQLNSTRQFMSELNRLGITSVSDAGGGFQNYPDDYEVIKQLADNDLMTVRIAYNLFTQKNGEEYNDFKTWVDANDVNKEHDFLRLDGAGEMLVYSASDFEDFLQERPEFEPIMESELETVVELLVAHRWPFRLHATYNESISRFLNVFEKVNSYQSFKGLRWNFDHAETISEANLERVKKLNGGIAIQDRMAFQGEYFINRYGSDAVKQTPPVRKIFDLGIPMGNGTDATRVSSYNPWVSLYWTITGKTVGGTAMYDDNNLLNRTEALKLYTVGSATLTGEETKKGMIKPGMLADLTVLSRDYFNIPEAEIKMIAATLTIVGGKIVYADKVFSKESPPALPISPGWSPVKLFGGYYNIPVTTQEAKLLETKQAYTSHSHNGHLPGHKHWVQGWDKLWGFGCDCFAI